jgi:integrase
MAGQYQDRQDSNIYGSRLIIHRRVDLDNNNFYFRAKVSGHTGCQNHRFDLTTSHVIRTERSAKTSPQAIVNMFASWFEDMGLNGCSSHSGRRTFITNAARKISNVGGSLRDVQMLAGHSSLAVTQRYIKGDGAARAKVVEFV